GLNRNRGAVALITAQIDPAMETWMRQRIEVGVLAGRREDNGAVLLPDEARHRFDWCARGERGNEGDTRSFAIAGDGVVDAQIAEQRLWSDAKRSAAGDDLRAGSGFTEGMQNAAG